MRAISTGEPPWEEPQIVTLIHDHSRDKSTMWHSPISNWIRGALAQTNPPRGRSKRNRRPRDLVERLEDRALLSGHVLMVTNPNDFEPGSLRTEVAAAASGDTIEFSSALAKKPISLLSPITINKQLTITGFGPTQLHISDANFLQDRHLFDIGANGNVTISGLTLTQAQGAERAQDGGAIQNAGKLTLNDVAIESCSALYGGAVYNTGSLTITGCALESDTAEEGGAIYNMGTLILSDSTVLKDSATNDGGGVDNYAHATATISNCTFAEDHANVGGALIDVQTGTMAISESTIAFNSASTRGGGVTVNSTAVLQITNTIVAMNDTGAGGLFDPNVFGAVSSQGFNLIGNATGSSGWVQSDRTGNDNKLLNPLLGSLHTQGLQSYYTLLSGSPALTTGNPAGAPALDQIGHPRVVNGKIDIGAIENQSTAAVSPIGLPLSQLGTAPSFAAQDSAVSTLFTEDSELWDLLSSGTN
jgi:hypothetical protein